MTKHAKSAKPKVKLAVLASPVMRQAGAIPFRFAGASLEVLLVTSRDTGRWIIPKGNVELGSTPHETAAREALEEAGIQGVVESDTPIGFYTYQKRLKNGRYRPATVETYLLRVTRQKDHWPEKSHRKLAWMSLSDALACIQEPGLPPLLKRLGELEEFLCQSALSCV